MGQDACPYQETQKNREIAWVRGFFLGSEGFQPYVRHLSPRV